MTRMTNNKSKYYVIALFICWQLLVMISLPTDAQANSVIDCLENEEDCEELIDSSGENSDTNNDELVGNESFEPTSLLFNVIKMIVALLFVLALIYGIVLVLRKRNKLMQHNELIENLGGISVGANKSIQLIRIGSHIYAVGVGEHVDLMLEITEPEVIEALLESNEKDAQDTFLTQLFQRKRKTENNNEQFIDQLNDELSKLQTNRETLVNNTAKKDDEHV